MVGEPGRFVDWRHGRHCRRPPGSVPLVPTDTSLDDVAIPMRVVSAGFESPTSQAPWRSTGFRRPSSATNLRVRSGPSRETSNSSPANAGCSSRGEIASGCRPCRTKACVSLAGAIRTAAFAANVALLIAVFYRWTLRRQFVFYGLACAPAQLRFFSATCGAGSAVCRLFPGLGDHRRVCPVHERPPVRHLGPHAGAMRRAIRPVIIRGVNRSRA